MTLDAGKLRHRLTILAPVDVQDAVTGEMEDYWYELGVVWGSFEPYSTKDILAAAALQDKTSARAVLRYRNDIYSEMRVAFRDKLYEIVGAPLPDPDSGLEYMTLMLKEVNSHYALSLPSDYTPILTGIAFVRFALETDSIETSFSFPSIFLEGSLLVYINGILATVGSDYTEKVDRSGVDFATAPAEDDDVEVFYAKGV